MENIVEYINYDQGPTEEIKILEMADNEKLERSKNKIRNRREQRIVINTEQNNM